MKLQLSGQEHFNAPPHEVFRFLTDVDSLTASIPDLVSSQRVDDRTVDCVVKPGFSFLRGTLKMRISFVDFEPTSNATMLINAQGIGLTMGATTKMQLAPTGEGTRLDWQAEVTELKGLVATLSGGLIRAAAEQVIRHGWGQMHKRLGGTKS